MINLPEELKSRISIEDVVARYWEEPKPRTPRQMFRTQRQRPQHACQERFRLLFRLRSTVRYYWSRSAFIRIVFYSGLREIKQRF